MQKQLRITLKVLFLLVLAMALSSACTVKTLYHQLDWLLADHIESYVELNNEQQKLLYRQVDRFLLWHKSTQLPIYVDWLQDFKRDIQQQPTTKAIEQNIEQFILFLRVLRGHAVDEAMVLLARLSKAQRAELYRGMEKKNQEFADKFIHISRQEQLEQYIERTEDRFDEWLGSLTEEQERLIEQSAGQIQPVATFTLQSRRSWQQAFKAALESNKNEKQLRAAIYDLFVNLEKRRSPQYRSLLRHNHKLFTKLIVDVARSLTSEQKKYFNNKVDNYSYHFTQLAREGKEESAAE